MATVLPLSRPMVPPSLLMTKLDVSFDWEYVVNCHNESVTGSTGQLLHALAQQSM
jgi:hypothetical protein